MSMQVIAAVDGRFEDRLASAAAGGFLAATDRAVSRWSWSADGALDSTVVHVGEDSHPGPLAVLADGRIAWGPTVLDGDRPAWTAASLVAAATADLGAGAAKRFQLFAGAVSGDAAHVALVLTRPRPKAPQGLATDVDLPFHRTAVVATDPAALVEILDLDRPPTTIAWAEGPLLLGVAGRVDVHGGEPLAIGDGTAARSLAVARDGTIAAGSASGRVYTRALEWAAHDDAVTALSWSADADRLATGAADGRLRVWSHDGDRRDDLELDGGVEAIAWLDGDTLVAKSGGQGGVISVLRLHR